MPAGVGPKGAAEHGHITHALTAAERFRFDSPTRAGDAAPGGEGGRGGDGDGTGAGGRGGSFHEREIGKADDVFGA